MSTRSDKERAADEAVRRARLAGAASAHATTHSSGGTDAVTITNLAGFPGGTANFLRADATFAAPGGGGGAPTTVDYLVRTADATLTAERVVTDTASIVVDWATAAQAKFNVQFGSTATTATVGNDARLSDARTPTSHVIATELALGGQHTISGATAGHVLRASAAAAANFQQLAHADLSSVGTNTHAQLDTHLAAAAPHTGHALSATLISTTAPLAGGGDLSANRTLTVAAATTLAVGVVELATSGENAANVVVQGNDARLADARTPSSHVVATNLALGAQHTISGATAGHVLRASAAAAANFEQLAHADLSSVGTNTHAAIDTHLAAAAPHTGHAALVHATRHQDAGADEINVAGLSGQLADGQIASILRETFGPTNLTIGTITDGELLKRVGATIVSAAAGAGSVNITSATLDFGTEPRKMRRFTIVDASVLATSQLMVMPGSIAPAGQPWNATDEWEMDPATFIATPDPAGGIYYVSVSLLDTESPARGPSARGDNLRGRIIGTRSINVLVG